MPRRERSDRPLHRCERYHFWDGHPVARTDDDEKPELHQQPKFTAKQAILVRVKIKRHDVTVVLQFSKDLECSGCEVGDTVSVKNQDMVSKSMVLQRLRPQGLGFRYLGEPR